MTRTPDIRVVTVEHGRFPEASALNRKISPDSLLLRATLDISWEVADGPMAVGRLEEALLAFSPGFAEHECRGPLAYHVFLGDGRHPRAGPAQPFDPCLALAHLIEHAIIDFQCAICDQKRCSGVTGAHRRTPGRYDVMVECPECSVGRCCLGLVLTALSAATDGRPPAASEREALLAARLAYHHAGRGLTPRAVARELGWSEGQARRALSALKEVGYLSESPYTVNFSGVPEYRVFPC